jgi:uncharacterized membrane protein YbhN (UPF0104 family)
LSSNDDEKESVAAEIANKNPGSQIVSRLGESAKITAIVAIMFVAFWLVKWKLKEAGVTIAKVQEGISNVPYWQIGLAFALTALNYLILTGYDWIAVRHLKKSLPMSKVMTGAIVGYSYGNVLITRDIDCSCSIQICFGYCFARGNCYFAVCVC